MLSFLEPFRLCWVASKMARERSAEGYESPVGEVDEKDQSSPGQDIEMQSVDIQKIEKLYR